METIYRSESRSFANTWRLPNKSTRPSGTREFGKNGIALLEAIASRVEDIASRLEAIAFPNFLELLMFQTFISTALERAVCAQCTALSSET